MMLTSHVCMSYKQWKSLPVNKGWIVSLGLLLLYEALDEWRSILRCCTSQTLFPTAEIWFFCSNHYNTIVILVNLTPENMGGREHVHGLFLVQKGPGI